MSALENAKLEILTPRIGARIDQVGVSGSRDFQVVDVFAALFLLLGIVPADERRYGVVCGAVNQPLSG